MSMLNFRELNGYRVVKMPEHPRSMTSENWKGFIYEHLLVAEKYLGRPLKYDEIVHHLDGDRSNNRHENLLVLLKGQHVKLHTWLDKGAPVVKTSGEKGMNSGKPKVFYKFCLCCGLTLQDKQEMYCSPECSLEVRNSKSKKPPKEELEELLKSESRESIGRKFGVSGNSVKKWQKSYGILRQS